ncbi:unnamed protein product [Cylindrotheca closterium]|uniref:Sulfotransferase domain-containing protein n=1 Tax=Cylindrotheca closterium TaxID=2856 RepID=A0AAD2C9V4_9STRA|nr:unnamed protein product [Cylindrotheca closterium]
MGRKKSKAKNGGRNHKNNRNNNSNHRSSSASEQQPVSRNNDKKNQPRQPNNYLNFLNRQLAFRLLFFYLDETDRLQLGKAYPRFQNAKLPTVKPSQVSEDGGDQSTPKTKTKTTTANGDQELTKIKTITIPQDPHTLLARLNTRRLAKRIRYLGQQQCTACDDDAKVYNQHVYAKNKTTEQIAIAEWQGLMVDYKKKLAQEQKEEAEEDAEDNNNKGTNVAVSFPSQLELLLFSPCPRAVAVLASYPRSGNSLLRTLYERTTLRVTGSDMRGGLTKHDLVGEAATESNAVQFVKTHYPERRGSPPFLVNRAVLLVRNPYDAMESYFNLMMTNTHTTSLTEEQRKRNAAVFAEMARKEIQVWRDFHEYWLAQQIPLLVIRYEDLIRHTDKVIAKVIRFTLEVQNMGFFEDRISRCIREEQIENLGSYRPRSGGIGKSLSTGMYSTELLNELNRGITDTMIKFGYEEMMKPNPEDWKLEPLDQFGVEIDGKPNSFMSINGKGLVRGPKRFTNWKDVRRQMAQDNDEKKSC